MPGVSGELKVRGPPISGAFAKLPGVVPSWPDEGLLPSGGSENLLAGSCVGSSVMMRAFPMRARTRGGLEFRRDQVQRVCSQAEIVGILVPGATTPRRKIWRNEKCQAVQAASVSRPAPHPHVEAVGCCVVLLALLCAACRTAFLFRPKACDPCRSPRNKHPSSAGSYNRNRGRAACRV